MPNFATIAVLITLIVMGSLTFTILGVVSLITKNSLKKIGYHPNISQQTFQQLQDDLNQVATDLSEIQFELNEIEPSLQQMEFLKYANENGSSLQPTMK